MRSTSAALTFTMGLLVGALVFSLLLGYAKAEPSSTSTADDRLQRLEDRAAIEELLVEYGRDLDHRDFAAYANLFSVQGTWSGSIGTFTGPAAIRAAMEKAFKSTSGQAVPATFHLMTNFSVAVRGDEATASSKWTFFRMVEGKPVPSLAGMYDDSFVRESGHWRFLRRAASAAQSSAG
jgi:SnoaL-like domain